MALEELEPSVSLPRFTGYNPARWLCEVERYFSFYAISDEERFPYVVEFFDDEPFYWFNSWYRGPQSLTWKFFTTAMLTTFSSVQKTVPPTPFPAPPSLTPPPQLQVQPLSPPPPPSPVTPTCHSLHQRNTSSSKKHTLRRQKAAPKPGLKRPSSSSKPKISSKSTTKRAAPKKHCSDPRTSTTPRPFSTRDLPKNHGHIELHTTSAVHLKMGETSINGRREWRPPWRNRPVLEDKDVLRGGELIRTKSLTSIASLVFMLAFRSLLGAFSLSRMKPTVSC